MAVAEAVAVVEVEVEVEVEVGVEVVQAEEVEVEAQAPKLRFMPWDARLLISISSCEYFARYHIEAMSACAVSTIPRSNPAKC